MEKARIVFHHAPATAQSGERVEVHTTVNFIGGWTIWADFYVYLVYYVGEYTMLLDFHRPLLAAPKELSFTKVFMMPDHDINLGIEVWTEQAAWIPDGPPTRLLDSVAFTVRRPVPIIDPPPNNELPWEMEWWHLGAGAAALLALALILRD